MGKTRVYKLAKDLGLSHADLIQRLQSLDIHVQNHMSTLSDEDVERVKIQESSRTQEGTEVVQVKDVRIQPGVIRRRRTVTVQPPPVAPEPEPPARDTPLQPGEEIPGEQEGVEAPDAAPPAPPEESIQPPAPEDESPAVPVGEPTAEAPVPPPLKVVVEDPLHRPHTYTPIRHDPPPVERAKPVAADAARAEKPPKKAPMEGKGEKGLGGQKGKRGPQGMGPG
jgi:hypothetical protein